MLVGHVKSTSEVESPCFNICKLEDGYCIGCGRSYDEIGEWYYADNNRKLEILKRIKNGKFELYMSQKYRSVYMQ